LRSVSSRFSSVSGFRPIRRFNDAGSTRKYVKLDARHMQEATNAATRPRKNTRPFPLEKGSLAVLHATVSDFAQCERSR